MKNTIFKTSIALLLVATNIALSGCGNKSETKSPGCSVPAPGAAPVPSALNPRYEATLSEGIDFKKDGYPNFLNEVTGVSVHEDWGRWTEEASGPAAVFRFSQPLPPKFTLEISVRAYGPNVDQPVKVRVGSVESTFVVPADAPVPSIYSLVFESKSGSDSIEILPPKPACPAERKESNDTRKLGIGLYSLKILK
jgi:phosphoglycerol transferase